MRIIDDITEYIFVSDEPQPSDILFIPGGPWPALGERAGALWKAGWAPLVMPSGRFSVKAGAFGGPKADAERYNGDYRTEWEFCYDVLVQNGVDASAILREDRSGYTRENASLSREAADRHNLEVRKALLVCKSFHARRALMSYQFAFPEAEFRVQPVDCQGVTRENWHTFDYGIERVLGELARCGSQFGEEIRRLKGLTTS